MKEILKNLESPDGKYGLQLESKFILFGCGNIYSLVIQKNSSPKFLRGILKRKVDLGTDFYQSINLKKNLETISGKIKIIPEKDCVCISYKTKPQEFPRHSCVERTLPDTYPYPVVPGSRRKYRIAYSEKRKN